MGMKQVSTKLDDETIEAATAIGIAAGHSCMFETYRELILEGVRSWTARPHATLVRHQVKEELDIFASGLGVQLEMAAANIADTLDDRLSSQADMASLMAAATLKLVSEALAAQPGELRTAEEIRLDATDGLWQMSSQMMTGGNL